MNYTQKLDITNPMKEVCYDAYALEVKKAKYTGRVSCSEGNEAADLCLDVQNNKLGQMNYYSTFWSDDDSTGVSCFLTHYQYCRVKYIEDYEVYRSVYCEYQLDLPNIEGNP
jgi:hypothetical protein